MYRSLQAAVASLALYVLQHPDSLGESQVLAKKLVKAVLDNPETVEQVSCVRLCSNLHFVLLEAWKYVLQELPPWLTLSMRCSRTIVVDSQSIDTLTASTRLQFAICC